MWNFYNPIQRVNQIGSWMVGVERDVLFFLFVKDGPKALPINLVRNADSKKIDVGNIVSKGGWVVEEKPTFFRAAPTDFSMGVTGYPP